MDDGDEWCEDALLPDLTRARILALKLFRHRSISHKDRANALELSTPVLKMLTTVIEQDGALVADEEQE
jgi:sister chromatid cohesion protein PDS5